MKISRTSVARLLPTILAASAVVVPAQATELGGTELSASVGVANMYLWRGMDVGNGDPAVFGDITASYGGAYASIWASSGDATAGQEYDLIIGYGAEFGDFFFDIAAVSYVFPRYSSPDVPDQRNDIGDWVEAILTLGYGPVSVSYFDTIEAHEHGYSYGKDYSYFSTSATFGPISILAGRHNMDDGNPVHLDLSYAYNDRLSFTISKFVANSNNIEHDANFVVSYTLPLN